MASPATKSPKPRTIVVLLKVDEHGNPRDPSFDWPKYLEQQHKLRAGNPIPDVQWRTCSFSTLNPGARIYIVASHPDRENEPHAQKRRAVIGYGEATSPSFRMNDRNNVKLRLEVALKPNQALPKYKVEKALPGVILWNQSNDKEITDYNDKMKELFESHLAEISFFDPYATSADGVLRSHLSGTPNPERRKLVEDNAINLVWNRFEEFGYKIKNRQDDNCGWDLEAIRGTERLKLEVKGLSGADLNADLTVNEFEQLMLDENLPDYRVCVLLDALRPAEANLHIIAHEQRSGEWRDQHGHAVNFEPRTAARLTWRSKPITKN